MSDVSSDSHLVARVQSGELAALGEVYDKYRLPVFRVALAITRDRQAAEAILRDCFVSLHTRLASSEYDGPLTPVLYRTAAELSYGWVTRHSKWWTSLEGLLDRFDRLAAPARAARDHQLDLKTLQEHIDRAIDALPFNQRIVVILFYMGGLSLKEIAYILECPVGTAKSRLHYGRESIRQHFQADVGSPPLPSVREWVHTTG